MADEIPEGLTEAEADQLVETKLKSIYATLAEVGAIAEKYRLRVYFDFAGHGATFFHTPELDEDGNFVGVDEDEYEWLGGDYGWRSSSSMC